MRTKTPAVAERMLDAAAQLFGTQRFHEVRMEDIAAEAEVGKGTLYRYFSDKEELFLALVSRSSEQFICRVKQDVSEVEGSRAKLEALVASVIRFFDERPYLFDLIQRAEVMTSPGLPWRQSRESLIALATEIFKEGNARKELHVAEPELATLLLLGGLRSLIRFGPMPRPACLARRVVSLFCP